MPNSLSFVLTINNNNKKKNFSFLFTNFHLHHFHFLWVVLLSSISFPFRKLIFHCCRVSSFSSAMAKVPLFFSLLCSVYLWLYELGELFIFEKYFLRHFLNWLSSHKQKTSMKIKIFKIFSKNVQNSLNWERWRTLTKLTKTVKIPMKILYSVNENENFIINSIKTKCLSDSLELTKERNKKFQVFFLHFS